MLEKFLGGFLVLLYPLRLLWLTSFTLFIICLLALIETLSNFDYYNLTRYQIQLNNNADAVLDICKQSKSKCLLSVLSFSEDKKIIAQGFFKELKDGTPTTNRSRVVFLDKEPFQKTPFFIPSEPFDTMCLEHRTATADFLRILKIKNDSTLKYSYLCRRGNLYTLFVTSDENCTECLTKLSDFFNRTYYKLKYGETDSFLTKITYRLFDFISYLISSNKDDISKYRSEIGKKISQPFTSKAPKKANIEKDIEQL
jgi:hypothetical protein